MRLSDGLPQWKKVFGLSIYERNPCVKEKGRLRSTIEGRNDDCSVKERSDSKIHRTDPFGELTEKTTSAIESLTTPILVQHVVTILDPRLFSCRSTKRLFRKRM